MRRAADSSARSRRAGLWPWLGALLWLGGLWALLCPAPAAGEQRHQVEYYFVSYCESCDPAEDFRRDFRTLTGLDAAQTDFRAYNTATASGRAALEQVQTSLDLEQVSLPMAVVDGVAYQGAGQIDRELPQAALSWGLPTQSTVVYLYTPACESCQAARQAVEALPSSVEIPRGSVTLNSPVEVIRLDATAQPQTAQALFDAYGIAQDRRVTPAVFLPEMALVGALDIQKYLAAAVEQGMAVGIVESAGAQRSGEAAGAVGVAQVAAALGAGLAAGLNGCALSMLLMFLSVLVSARAHAIPCAAAFLLAKLAVYLLIGFALLSLMQRANPAWLTPLAKWLLTGVGAALAGLNLYDAAKARKGQLGAMKNQLPQGLRGKLHRAIAGLTGKRVLVPASAALGAVVAAGEFLCSGQLYLATLLSQAGSPGGAFSVTAYCAAFLIPSAVLAAAVVGGGSAQGVSAFMARHVVGAKVAAAVAMAALIALAWLV